MRPRFDPWVGKIPWRRKWKSTPVLLPGKSHGQRSLVGYSPWGPKESDTTEQLNWTEYSIVYMYHNFLIHSSANGHLGFFHVLAIVKSSEVDIKVHVSSVAQMVKRLSTMQETRVRSLGWEDPLEKEMATHSSTIAWKIPWTEEPGRLQSMGSQKVRHDWATSLSFTLYPMIYISYFKWTF